MHRPHHRTPLGRASRAALLLLAASWGCGGGSTSEPKWVKPNRPTRVVVVTSPTTTAGPGAVAGDFVVRVEDAAGAGLPNVGVTFKALSGATTGFKFAPADTTTTDASGIARVAVTFPTKASSDQLLAAALGLAEPAAVNVTITPGPAAYVFLNPGSVLLYGAGDSASFQLQVADVYLNAIKDVTPLLQLSDSTLISITPPAAFGANGTVRALKGGGAATVTATAAGQSGKLTVGLYPNPRNVCGGIAPMDIPVGFPFGQPVTVTDTVACIPPNIDGAVYTLMVYNESTDGATSLGTTVTGTNVALELPLAMTRVGSRPALSRAPTLARRSSIPKRDLRFHEGLLERSRSLRRLFEPARAARSFARAGSTGRIRGPSYALSSSAPSVPAVDDLLSLNVASDACTTADLRTFRVEAVGTQAIVLADTANPTGGFTRADYQRFAARFDTLVYPLDVNAFDAPTDIDGNAHVAILFTKAVNELTPANSGTFVGGFFHPRDLFPRTQSPTFGVCPTSNEGEMFYMMVPDPAGTVNGNEFGLGFVDTLTTGILAHEFQHLINAGRRMYVNTSATDFEVPWLNEGLSHEAEELLFFHESGYGPRSRLTAQSILNSFPHFAAWVADDASNFVNFFLYLSAPATHSPIVLDDAIETRGAAWAFLRYAVDKSFTSDAGAWKGFTNSTTTGLGTLAFALQRDPKPLLQGFAEANMTNSHPSWNFGSVYSQVFVGESYPVPYDPLKEGTAISVSANGGSASFYQFSVVPNVQALLRFGSSAAPPNSNLKFVLSRTFR